MAGVSEEEILEAEELQAVGKMKIKEKLVYKNKYSDLKPTTLKIQISFQVYIPKLRRSIMLDNRNLTFALNKDEKIDLDLIKDKISKIM